MSAQSREPHRPADPARNQWSQASAHPGQSTGGYDRPTPRRGVPGADVHSPAAADGWSWEGDSAPTGRHRAQSRGGGGYGIVALILLALAVLCITGFLVARVFFTDSSPALPPIAGQTPLPSATRPAAQPTQSEISPGSVRITINPTQGYFNTLITVTGEGWWPGEPVFIFLRSPGDGDSPGYAYAAAVTSDEGTIHTAFTFPNEMRWAGAASAEVTARGNRSGLEATTRFALIPPTPTSTVPPPTPRPTLPVTETPLATSTPLPTDTPEPTPTPDVIITEWRGEYFANMSPSGSPALIRNDVAIDFNWGTGSPHPTIPSDRFSARWTRQLRFQEGQYRFTLSSDDGIRFWIDGQLVVDEWHDGVLTDHTVTLALPKGRHALQLEYYENTGGALAQFRMARVEAPTATPTPTYTPTPMPGPTDTPPPTTPPSAALPERWSGEYFSNPALVGDPVLVRQDRSIDFDWGTGSPDAGIPADGFSVRWTGELWSSGGGYAYYLIVDDGARIWLDGQLLIDAAPAVLGQTYSSQVLLSEGAHSFRVEYFEAAGQARIRLWAEAQTRPQGD